MEASAKHFRKRNAILECLYASKEHPSAEMLYMQIKEQIPDISMGTVYRNLNLFKKQGVIASVATVAGVERFDGNTDPHVHFICTACDRVIDLADLQVPQSLCSSAEKSVGGEISACQLSFTGVCRNCLEIQDKRGESA